METTTDKPEKPLPGFGALSAEAKAKPKKRKRREKPSEAKARANRANGLKGGRPKVLTEADYDRVLEGLMDGRSLTEVCRKPGLPCVKTILKRVVDERSGFGEAYARAREVGLLQMEDELLQLSDGAGQDEKDPKLANAAVQRARLQVDTRKWVMSKQNPRRYGDRVIVGGDADSAPIQLSNADAAREVALLLATAAARRIEAERKAEVESIELVTTHTESTVTVVEIPDDAIYYSMYALAELAEQVSELVVSIADREVSS